MNHVFHNASIDREIDGRNAPMRDAFRLVSEKATICTCGIFPNLRDMPTITGRSMHFLECKCGETGVVVYDGEMYSNDFVNKAIDGWNCRKELKSNGVTEILMI